MTDTTLDAVTENTVKKVQRCRATGQLMLALLMTAGFFGIIGLSMYHEIPDKNHDIVIALMGALGTLMTQTWAYYFASSIGSRNKDEAMTDAIKTMGPDGTPPNVTQVTQVNPAGT